MGRTVAAEDDLLLRIVERVERVEEFGLRPFLSGEKLDVVDQQHVDRSVALAKIEHAVVADRVDHFVHETLGRDVRELQISIVFEDVLTDGMHQMRLAEAHAAVDEQRVVRSRRRFGHGAAGGMRELIRGSDDERVERVAGIEACGRRSVRDAFRGLFERRRFLGAERNRRRVGVWIADEAKRQIRAQHLGHRFGDDLRVVLRQPVLEERVRHANGHRIAVFGDERGRPEPGVERVPADLGLYTGEELIPEIHATPRNYTGIGRKQTRAVRECCISKRKHVREVISCDFPQVFPQVWKTLGVDQTPMGFTRPERPEKDADCSTVRLALTLLETVRYH